MVEVTLTPTSHYAFHWNAPLLQTMCLHSKTRKPGSLLNIVLIWLRNAVVVDSSS